ncbi:hypothetical protein [Bradyrhizobium elkanii]|uniref:hypothetical protein n=1 Tax=Bradyrhizobium elkanii TaxID=29448 RepID=UPI003519B25E
MAVKIANAKILLSAASMLLFASLPVSAQSPTEEALAGFNRVIAADNAKLVSQWSSPKFSATAKPYLTTSLIGSVRQAIAIMRKNRKISINLWDGDFVTGAQGQVRVVAYDEKILDSTSTEARLSAKIITSDTETMPTKGPSDPVIVFHMKKEDGVWKLDDILESGRASRKAHFLDPLEYGTRMD